jgi:hypothetical protein
MQRGDTPARYPISFDRCSERSAIEAGCMVRDIRVDGDPYSDESPVQPRIAFVEDAEVSKAMVVYHSKKNAL